MACNSWAESWELVVTNSGHLFTTVFERKKHFKKAKRKKAKKSELVVANGGQLFVPVFAKLFPRETTAATNTVSQTPSFSHSAFSLFFVVSIKNPCFGPNGISWGPATWCYQRGDWFWPKFTPSTRLLTSFNQHVLPGSIFEGVFFFTPPRYLYGQGVQLSRAPEARCETLRKTQNIPDQTVSQTALQSHLGLPVWGRHRA